MLAGLSLSAGEVFNLKASCSGTTVQWTDLANYDEEHTNAPGSDDLVFVPANVTVTVDDTTFDQIGSVCQIRPDSGATVVFDLAEDHDLSAAVTYMTNTAATTSYTYRGMAVKRGTGVLSLGSAGLRPRSTSSCYDYAVAWTVENGCLLLPPKVGKFINMFIDSIAVSRPGIVQVRFEGQDVYLAGGLSGDGTIGHASTGRAFVQSMTRSAVFSGDVTGDVRLYARDPNHTLYLTGTNNASPSNARACLGGIIALQRFGYGTEDVHNSLGTQKFIQFDASGAYLYLGSGETTDRYFEFGTANSSGANDNIIDAGAVGGLVFLGGNDWKPESVDTNKRLVFAGSNAVPCQVMADVTSKTSGGTTAHVSISKRGTGSWQFLGNRSYAGGWWIDEGVLGFDSLDEKGTKCALGTATLLLEDKCCSPQQAQTNEYAIALGTAKGTEGVLDFIGTNLTWCTTRPIVLAGPGRIRNSSDVSFRLAGIGTLGEGPRTLTLDGTHDDDSEIAGILDSSSNAISVVKAGPGTWTLNGSNVIHGTISVQGGTLKVRRDPATYTWYKFVIRDSMHIEGVARAQFLYLQELGIYDADGRRLNGKLEWTALANQSIHPGQATVPRRGKMCYGWKKTGENNLENLFDGSNGASSIWEVSYNSSDDYEWGSTASRETVELDKPATWIPVVMHLTNTAAAASYDVGLRYNMSWPNSTVTAWTLYGSTDGIVWDELSVTNQLERFLVGDNGDRWATTGTSMSAANIATHTTGYPIRGSALTPPPFTVMDNVTSILVAEGAQFLCEGAAPTVRGLVVDAAGAGLVSNVAFAASGTLEVTGVDPKASAVKLPGTYADVTGLENLAGVDWTLSVNGNAKLGDRYDVSVRNGEITLNKKGLVLIVR